MAERPTALSYCFHGFDSHWNLPLIFWVLLLPTASNFLRLVLLVNVHVHLLRTTLCVFVGNVARSDLRETGRWGSSGGKSEIAFGHESGSGRSLQSDRPGEAHETLRPLGSSGTGRALRSLSARCARHTFSTLRPNGASLTLGSACSGFSYDTLRSDRTGRALKTSRADWTLGTGVTGIAFGALRSGCPSSALRSHRASISLQPLRTLSAGQTSQSDRTLSALRSRRAN